MSKPNEETLIERIKKFLGVDAETRVITRVVERSERILTKTVNDTANDIQALEYKVVDTTKLADEAYLKIDVEAADQDLDRYAAQWLDNIKKVASDLEDYKEQLADKKEILAATKELQKKIKVK